jgi:hypothetical protein
MSIRLSVTMMIILVLLVGCGKTEPTALLRQAQDKAAATVTPEPFTDTPTPPSETPLPQPEPLPVLAEWSGAQGPVYSVDWSPDGRTIATTGRRHVSLWDGETYEELAILEGLE